MIGQIAADVVEPLEVDIKVGLTGDALGISKVAVDFLGTLKVVILD